MSSIYAHARHDTFWRATFAPGVSAGGRSKAVADIAKAVLDDLPPGLMLTAGKLMQRMFLNHSVGLTAIERQICTALAKLRDEPAMAGYFTKTGTEHKYGRVVGVYRWHRPVTSTVAQAILRSPEQELINRVLAITDATRDAPAFKRLVSDAVAMFRLATLPVPPEDYDF